MRKPIVPRLIPSLLLAAAMTAGCIMQGKSDGGGSETTLTGFAGRAVDASGKPLADAAVRARLSTEMPAAVSGFPGDDAAPSVYTDGEGRYVLQGVAPGSYFVEVRGKDSTAALLAADMPSDDTLLQLPDAVLRPTGAIEGRVRGAEDTSGMLDHARMFAFLLGLPQFTQTDTAGADQWHSFRLEGIPAGDYTLDIHAPYPGQLAIWNILRVPVRVEPGQTARYDSLEFPLRSGVRDSAYSRDSAAVRAILDSNGMQLPVEYCAAAEGNRIRFLYFVLPGLKTLPREIGRLDSLENLIVIGTAGGQVSLSVSPEIRRLGRLRRVMLQNVNLDPFPPWLASQASLSNVYLNIAGLKTFPAELVNLPLLSVLDLTANQISSLPPSIARSRLKSLSMGANLLDKLPPEILGMKSLRGFNARGNRLCHLGPAEKSWMTMQDSLWRIQADPLSFPPGTPGWEADQDCP